MVTLKCLECSKEFEAQRSSAKFCSTKCRVDYNRKSEEEKSVIQPTDIIQEKIEKQVENFVKLPTTEPELKGIIPTKKETTTFQGFVELVNPQTEPPNTEKSSSPRLSFKDLLVAFNSLVNEQKPINQVEHKFYELIEKSKQSDLNARQSEAIRDRCIYYLKGQYSGQKAKN